MIFVLQCYSLLLMGFLCITSSTCRMRGYHQCVSSFLAILYFFTMSAFSMDSDAQSASRDDTIIEEVVVPAVVTVVSHVFNEWCQTDRRFKWQHSRLNWPEHVAMLIHTKQFETKFHMSPEAFNKLVNILQPMIKLDLIKSQNSTPLASDHLYPELIMACGIHWLTEGSYHDIHDWAGISMNSFIISETCFLMLSYLPVNSRSSGQRMKQKCRTLLKNSRRRVPMGYLIDDVLVPWMAFWFPS